MITRWENGTKWNSKRVFVIPKVWLILKHYNRQTISSSIKQTKPLKYISEVCVIFQLLDHYATPMHGQVPGQAIASAAEFIYGPAHSVHFFVFFLFYRTIINISKWDTYLSKYVLQAWQVNYKFLTFFLCSFWWCHC